MCIECYGRDGFPVIINERVLSMAEAITEFMDENPGGQHAHCIFEDWNIDEDIIISCIDDCTEGFEDCRQILESFLSLSYDERSSSLALVEGIISKTGQMKESKQGE